MLGEIERLPPHRSKRDRHLPFNGQSFRHRGSESAGRRHETGREKSFRHDPNVMRVFKPMVFRFVLRPISPLRNWKGAALTDSS